ncbi:MAG: proton-conducting transporter membrane subunit, partial [Pirellulales bacterium]
AIGLSGVHESAHVSQPALAADQAALSVTPQSAASANAARADVDHREALSPVRRYSANLIAFLAAITCTFGNLAAYGQTNIKRLLAYSTIAHAGYLMMPVAAAIWLLDAGKDALAADALAALVFYVAVYFFMNLGAFAIVAFLRNRLRSEEIADYAGLVRHAPGLVLCFAVLLFSLVGLPPMAGFVAKFLIFVSLANAEMWTLLVIAGLNTALSLFYYLRVVKVMTIDPEPETRTPAVFPGLSWDTMFVVALTLPVLYFGIMFSGLSDLAHEAVKHLIT